MLPNTECNGTERNNWNQSAKMTKKKWRKVVKKKRSNQQLRIKPTTTKRNQRKPKQINVYLVLGRVQNHIQNQNHGPDLEAGLDHVRKHLVLVHVQDRVQGPVRNQARNHVPHQEVGPVHVHPRAVVADAQCPRQQVIIKPLFP